MALGFDPSGTPSSTGTQADVLARLKALLPPWFGNGPTPVLDALLTGPAWALANAFALLNYVWLQTRIRTATGSWLDLIAQDFFGGRVLRTAGQSDASFRATILANLLRPTSTRQALVQALTQLTGHVPQVLEPQRPLDVGAWDTLGGWDVSSYGWGDTAVHHEVFVTAFRGNGVADADIYATANAVRAAGITVWVQIQDPPFVPGLLDLSDPDNSGLSALL